MLDKLLDPVSEGMADTMQQYIFAAAPTKTKSLSDELNALKEVQARIREWERRCNLTPEELARSDTKKAAHDGQLEVYAGMVFTSVLSEATKREIQRHPDCANIKLSVDKMRVFVEQLQKLEVGARPVRKDLSAVSQYEEERWTAAECEEWYGGWNNGWWPEAETESQPETAPPGSNPSLDAFNQKGKGKGGRGKGKAKTIASTNADTDVGASLDAKLDVKVEKPPSKRRKGQSS